MAVVVGEVGGERKGCGEEGELWGRDCVGGMGGWRELSVGTLGSPWGLRGDSAGTPRGLRGDSAGTPCGFCGDSVGTPWASVGLRGDSAATPWGLRGVLTLAKPCILQCGAGVPGGLRAGRARAHGVPKADELPLFKIKKCKKRLVCGMDCRHRSTVVAAALVLDFYSPICFCSPTRPLAEARGAPRADV